MSQQSQQMFDRVQQEIVSRRTRKPTKREPTTELYPLRRLSPKATLFVTILHEIATRKSFRGRDLRISRPVRSACPRRSANIEFSPPLAPNANDGQQGVQHQFYFNSIGFLNLEDPANSRAVARRKSRKASAKRSSGPSVGTLSRSGAARMSHRFQNRL